MSHRDYTDSESEAEDALTVNRADESMISTPAGGSSPSKPGPSEGKSLKITLRPGLSHLANRDRDDSSAPNSERSSLSPPPSIKLKFGMKSARSHPVYSDSDESDTPAPTKPPPSKKHKPSKARGSTGSASAVGPPVPAPHRKAYNWLQPSAAGASHHGPPDRTDRAERHPSVATSVAPSAGGEDEKPIPEDEKPVNYDPARDSAPPSETKKKTRRRPGDVGPGKNWRKGMKKGDPIPWKDGATFLGEGGVRIRSSPLATPTRPSMSRDASPEPLDHMLLASATSTAREKREREREREHFQSYPREPSPPFVLADAKALGIPVFANPIAPPKLVLGNFPRLTSYFAPFDAKPYRKEKVRDWSYSERTIGGVGGSVLKFKTWRPGQPSELGAVLAAQREAEAIAKQKKKETKEAMERGEATPERPTFGHSLSTDSVPLHEDDGDNASEVGDDTESVAGSARDSPVPRGRGAASKRGRPRKSKLANEIIPLEPDDEGGPPTAEDTKPAIPA